MLKIHNIALLKIILIGLQASLITVVLFFSLTILVIIEKIPVEAIDKNPDNQASHQYVYDVVLVDEPNISKSEIDQLIRPMNMVFEHRLKTMPEHTRIFVYEDGFPCRMQNDRAYAAYIPDMDVFIVDNKRMREGIRNSPSEKFFYAAVMAHEATHRWQKYRGENMTRCVLHDPVAYLSDPIEIEAFQEGVSVASAISGEAYGFDDGHGRVIEPMVLAEYEFSMKSSYITHLFYAQTFRSGALKFAANVLHKVGLCGKNGYKQDTHS